MKLAEPSIAWLSLASFALTSQLCAQEPPKPPPADPLVVTTPALAGKGVEFQIGDAKMKLGGYVKIDLLHDFNAIDSPYNFDPRAIPTDGSEGNNTNMTARQTRLNLDLLKPTDAEPMHFFVEGDFAGSSNSFRLRQAYGEMGRLLGGQTWTSFMDENAMPETLDFESPLGFPQVRTAQIRYTVPLESGDSYAFSVEDPSKNIDAPPVPGDVESPLPDLTANYIWKNSRGHVQASAFGGMAGFQPDTGSDDTVALWGVNLSTKLDTFGEDYAILQYTYGDGVGRYRGGTVAAPKANGDLEAVTVIAWMGAYQHHWTGKWRSNITYSWADGDVPSGAPATSSETLQYFAVDLIYQFANRAWTGIEYLYGTNEAVDGSDGHANRLQLSIKYDL